MKKSHIYALTLAIVAISFVIVTKFDILDLLIKKNNWIQIIFFILTIAVAGFLMVPIINKKKLQISFNANIKKLSKTEDFNMMFEKIRKNTENDFENLKKRMIITVGVFVAINIILVIVALFVKTPISLEAMTSEFFKLIIVCVKILMFVITWTIFGFVFKDNLKEYHLMYKSKIISGIVNWLRNGLEYEHKNEEKEKVFKSHYINSGFETRTFNVFSAEDYIYGNINDGVNIRLADICTKKIEKIGTEEEQIDLLFSGLFVATAIKTSINSTIKLLTDDLKLVIEDDFVKMDNSELEKNFDVYCFDKMLVMRIFTTETMEMLNKFYEKYRIAFEMIIKIICLKRV